MKAHLIFAMQEMSKGVFICGVLNGSGYLIWPGITMNLVFYTEDHKTASNEKAVL